MKKHLTSTLAWALLCVAVTSAALIYFAYDKTEHLAGSDWCGRAIGAARATERPEAAIVQCYSLMKDQINALALDSHIAHGTLALCLLTLVVIVLAGARANFRAGRDGISGDISRDKAVDLAVDRVVDAAEDEAEIVKRGEP